MPSTLETLDILNDLININSHWIAGYEQAAKELRVAELELKILRKNLNEENEEDIINLSNEMEIVGESVKLVTTNSEKMYNAWLHIKEIFVIKDSPRTEVLGAVEKAYVSALASENLPSNLRAMIEGQKSVLKKSHDQILAYKNQ